MLEADFAVGELRLLKWGEEPEILLATDSHRKYMDREMEQFIDCGETPCTDGLDSLARLQVVWRLYEAEEQNKIADLSGLKLENIE